MNPFDKAIILWLNHFSGVSVTLNVAVKDISDNDLLQAVVPITILWACWFEKAAPAKIRLNRLTIVATLVAAISSVIFARALAFLLPFRARPYVNPELAFQSLDPSWNGNIHQWSAFPSDHAVLFFALATGITLLHRRIGIAMLIYAAVVDCLPRVYLGVHYPSDILAGAVLGSAATLLVAKSRIRQIAGDWVLRWAEIFPAWVYASLFLCSFELATMFDSALQAIQIGVMMILATTQHASFVQSVRIANITAAVALLLLLLVIGLYAMRKGRKTKAFGH